MRYVDLIMNPSVKETFVKRSKIIKTIKQVLDNKGYLELVILLTESTSIRDVILFPTMKPIE